MEIPLTKNKVAIIDDGDAPLVLVRKWQAHQSHGTWYASASVWVGGRKRHVAMHRMLLQAGPNEQVDHRDGDGLNNRRENLRLASNRQNHRNRRKKRPRSSSIFKGVDFFRRSGKWRARIKIDGRLRHLGEFETELEAALCYDRHAGQAFGEFARLNFTTGATQ